MNWRKPRLTQKEKVDAALEDVRRRAPKDEDGNPIFMTPSMRDGGQRRGKRFLFSQKMSIPKGGKR